MKIDPSIEVIDFSYGGKSNNSIFEDVFSNKHLLHKINRYVIGLSTPFRYVMHTDDGFRIDIIQDKISTIRYMKGEQPGTPPNNIDYIHRTVENFARINSDYHYKMNTIQSYCSIKAILQSKLLAFSIYRYDDAFFQNVFDLNTWLTDTPENGLGFMSDCFLPDKHLNEKGMLCLAEIIVNKLKISYNQINE